MSVSIFFCKHSYFTISHKRKFAFLKISSLWIEEKKSCKLHKIKYSFVFLYTVCESVLPSSVATKKRKTCIVAKVPGFEL